MAVVMVKDALEEEAQLDLALGPDIPSKMIFVLMPVLVAVLVGITAAAPLG